MFVGIGEGTHDAKIQCNVAAIRVHLDITGVHVSMKKTIAKNLSVENFHAISCQCREVDAGRTQCIHMIDGKTFHTLHHHHFICTPIPINFRDQQQFRIGKVAF